MVFNLCDIVRHLGDDGSADDLPLNFHPSENGVLWVDTLIGAGGTTDCCTELSSGAARLSVAVNSRSAKGFGVSYPPFQTGGPTANQESVQSQRTAVLSACETSNTRAANDRLGFQPLSLYRMAASEKLCCAAAELGRSCNPGQMSTPRLMPQSH